MPLLLIFSFLPPVHAELLCELCQGSVGFCQTLHAPFSLSGPSEGGALGALLWGSLGGCGQDWGGSMGNVGLTRGWGGCLGQTHRQLCMKHMGQFLRLLYQNH